MSEHRRVVVAVSPLGTVKIDAQGFVGNSCENATKAFEEVFAGNTSRDYKPEYYEADEENTNRLMF